MQLQQAKDATAKAKSEGGGRGGGGGAAKGGNPAKAAKAHILKSQRPCTFFIQEHHNSTFQNVRLAPCESGQGTHSEKYGLTDNQCHNIGTRENPRALTLENVCKGFGKRQDICICIVYMYIVYVHIVYIYIVYIHVVYIYS